MKPKPVRTFIFQCRNFNTSFSFRVDNNLRFKMARPRLGEVFPNFTADTTIGKIDFHEWLGDS